MTDNEDSRTIWCGNLSDKVTEDILFELFHQGGPLEKVRIPRDRDGRQRAFGFITYKHECSVPYALKVFEGTQLFNREINLKQRNGVQTDSLFPSPQLGPRANPQHVDRQRTQSVPANFNSVSSASESFEKLFQHGQNLFQPPGWQRSPMIGLVSPYASQMSSSLYLGGINSLSKNSLQGNWSNRNHPYLHGGGSGQKWSGGGRDSDHNNHRRRDERGNKNNNNNRSGKRR
ncbi:RNA-binding protein 7 [Anabrus simplex]|uniref:RNA-binding protein 7 n=1 Tax=Anabrus simplex TaxID=316456 RepID=UPI0034DD5ED4